VEEQKQGIDFIGHVANGEHPLIELPHVWGIDFSISKHVFMLWLVAGLLFIGITAIVRRYVRKGDQVPTGSANALEIIVEFVRESVRPLLPGEMSLLGEFDGERERLRLPRLREHWPALISEQMRQRRCWLGLDSHVVRQARGSRPTCPGE